MSLYNLRLIFLILFYLSTTEAKWSGITSVDNSLLENIPFTLFTTNTLNNLLFQIQLDGSTWGAPTITTINPQSTPSCSCLLPSTLNRLIDWSEPYSTLTNVAVRLSPLSNSWSPAYNHMMTAPYDSCSGLQTNLNNGFARHLTDSLITQNPILWNASINQTQLFNPWWWFTVHKANLVSLHIDNVYLVRMAKQIVDESWIQLRYNAGNLQFMPMNIDTIPIVSSTTIQSDEWIVLRGNLCSWLTCLQSNSIWNEDTLSCI